MAAQLQSRVILKISLIPGILILIRRERISDQIRAHFQGLLPFGFRIVVDTLVLPAISQVALKGIKNNQSAFVEKPKALGGFAVVFVNFGQAFCKFKFLVIDRMIKRQFYQFQFGKDLS